MNHRLGKTKNLNLLDYIFQMKKVVINYATSARKFVFPTGKPKFGKPS